MNDGRDGLRVRVSEEDLQRLFRYIYFRADRDAHVAEDLLQETCLAYLKSGETAARDPWNWLLGTANHLLSRHYRQRGRERRALQTRADLAPRPEGEAAWAEKEIQAEDTAKAFYLTLSRLAPEDQDLLIMKYRRKLSLEDMARQTGKSFEGLRSALARARAKFRATWEDTVQQGVDADENA